MKITRSTTKIRKTSSASLAMAFMCARAMAVTYLGLFYDSLFGSSRDQRLMRFRYLGAPRKPVDIDKVKTQMDGLKGIQLKR